MRTLHLTLKKKWFDMIASGEKKEEYREIKPYWIKRLVDKELFHGAESFNNWLNNKPELVTLHHIVNKYDTVCFTNGYSKHAPKVKVECLGIEIGNAKPEWSDNWQGEVFIIKLGNIIP